MTTSEDRPVKARLDRVMGKCGEHDGRMCDLPPGDHLYHHDHQGWWRNTAVEEAPRRRPRKRRKGAKVSQQARARALAARDATSPKDISRREEEWTEESWVIHARQTLRAFLVERAEPFTTPEHVWPLLPDPAPVDRRVFSRVVQAALREGWMTQDGSVRLEGGFTTADGTPFSMNKIVPVYRSLIC